MLCAVESGRDCTCQPGHCHGDPADLVKRATSGEIDALWQGAVAPIPSLREVADQADAVVFGLTDAESAAMLLIL
jgi:uncharacterized protein